MSAARRVVVGVENDDGSTVIWRFTSVLGDLRIDERFDMYLSGAKAGHHPHFMLDISGYGERIDTEGPLDLIRTGHFVRLHEGQLELGLTTDD